MNRIDTQDNNTQISIIMPALNEEKNILFSIDETLSAFKKYNLRGEIVVINDGSTDSTPQLVKQRINEKPGLIRIVNHGEPEGIGASFWDGADNAKGNAVCMIPGDNENEPREILRYLDLLENVDMVIPFVFNKTRRSRLRKILSFIYRFIINNTFLISLNYTNGTVLYRRSLLNELDYREGGFFFQTDILIRLIKRGYLFAEVPYRLKTRKEGSSKALSFHSFFELIKGYFRLVRDIYFKKEKGIKEFNPDSVSSRRYKEL